MGESILIPKFQMFNDGLRLVSNEFYNQFDYAIGPATALDHAEEDGGPTENDQNDEGEEYKGYDDDYRGYYEERRQLIADMDEEYYNVYGVDSYQDDMNRYNDWYNAEYKFDRRELWNRNGCSSTVDYQWIQPFAYTKVPGFCGEYNT